MKDFELYKKAFKQYVSGGLLPLGWGDDLDDKTSRQPTRISGELIFNP